MSPEASETGFWFKRLETIDIGKDVNEDSWISLETGKQPKLVQKSAINRDTNEILNPLTIQKGFRS